MRWTFKRVLKIALIAGLVCSVYAKLSSPVYVIDRSEDATVVLRIVKNVVQDQGPLLLIKNGKTVKPIKKPVEFLCAGYIADNYGHIVTAAHCVTGSRDLVSVGVLLRGEKYFYPAKVVLVRPMLDIALLRAPLPKGIPHLTVKEGYSAPGTHVYAIGHPLGLFYSVSDGVVSGYAYEMNGQIFVQVSAPINPGNSGGPIISDKGEVVGVCSNMSIGPWGTPALGLGFAVPSVTINIVMHGYLNHN